MKRLSLGLSIVMLCSPLMHAAPQESVYIIPAQPPPADYRLHITIDIEKDRIQGYGDITLVNSSTMPLAAIAFDWPQTDRYRLEVRQGDAVLSPLSLRRTSLDPVVYSLTEPLRSGETLLLHVRFSKQRFIEGDRERMYLQGCWYPKLWWDDIPLPETYAVSLDCPPGYTVAATGRQDDTGVYRGANLRQFSVYLGKDQKKLVESVEGVLVSVIYPAKGDTVAQTAFRMLQDAIPFFQELYGFFPFTYLTVIPGSSRGPWGGYNFAPGIAVIHGMEHYRRRQPGFWEWITVHELCHHYWGECVYDDDYPSWLWIGLGIYADQMYMRHIGHSYPVYSGFRNQYFYSGVMQHQNTTLDIPAELYEGYDFDWNNTVKHGKGFAVISALESVLGPETMQKVMQRCLDEFRWKVMDTDDLRQVAEAVSGRNLRWFFRQWVESDAYLSVSIADSVCRPVDDGFETTVILSCDGTLRMGIPVQVQFADSSFQRSVFSRAVADPSLTFYSAAEPVGIQLDPDHQLPPLQVPVPPDSEDVIARISQLPYTDVGEDALRPYEDAVTLNLHDASAWFGLGLRLYESGDLTRALDSFVRTAACGAAAGDTLKQVQGLCWQGMIHDQRGERDAALALYGQVLSLGYEFSMMSSQFGLSIDNAWVEERLRTPWRGTGF
ncbi:hypothetical protein JXO52_04540 [bacterium]|nr:hypothetical protein [bacterium]